MNELHPKIKQALTEIDFIRRYEELSNRFNSTRTPAEARLKHIDGSEVMDMIRNLGYVPKFDSKEKFFKIEEEHVGAYFFRVHIILQSGAVELVWVVKEGDELLLGSPWGIYAKRMIDPGYRIKMPVFGSYEDLEEILKVSFGMYEDFKRSVWDGN